MKKMMWLVMMCLMVNCTDEASTKEAPNFPSELKKDNGKGDWRTKHYTAHRGSISIDDTKFGTYAPQWPDFYYAYGFKANDGDTMGIRVGEISNGFDAVAGIYGPQKANGDWGELIAVNDDAPDGGTLDSYIELEVEADGKYLILFKEYSWNKGDYFVSVDCLGGSCEEVICPVYRCAACPTGTVYDENGCATCGCAPACPAAVQPPSNVRCAGVVTWAKATTGECCEYPSPCMVPPNMQIFDSEVACEGPAQIGDSCSFYGRHCDTNLECQFVCPDGTTDDDCNLGINPTGTCIQPAQCADDSDCVRTGCSGTICSDEPVITTCQVRPSDMCYAEANTSCGCNAGSCGFDQTAALTSCLASFGR